MAKIQDTTQNRQKCFCPKCPSYPQSCQGEVLYCAIGVSNCDINAKGCICNFCPIYLENQLDDLYFCDKTEVFEIKEPMRKKRSFEDKDFYQTVVDIKKMAQTGESITVAMGSQKIIPYSLAGLHFIPAQTAKIPLNKEETVKTEVTIGPGSKKPLKISCPIIISGMSFGATSKNVKLIVSKVAAKLKIGFNSGEGGILPEELQVAAKYLISQYATGRFGVQEDLLKKVAAVEIRFGQGAYPGKGSFLPASKMTPEVTKIRGLKGGEAAYSPAHHHDMTTPREIKDKVAWLKEITGGVPVGAKIGCGNVENDIKVLVDANVDFIAIDGFGGGTGATDAYIRENVGIPILAALPRAYQFLKKLGIKNKISLITSGNLRTSADFAKCLALGADAVYIGTAALIAINCQQFRICHTGLCPTGVTTHDPNLTGQLKVEDGIKKLSNFIKIATEEIANLTRITGKGDINKLDIDDLVSIDKDLAQLTGVKWLNNKIINN